LGILAPIIITGSSVFIGVFAFFDTGRIIGRDFVGFLGILGVLKKKLASLRIFLGF
jgi:hypothetical protein